MQYEDAVALVDSIDGHVPEWSEYRDLHGDDSFREWSDSYWRPMRSALEFLCGHAKRFGAARLLALLNAWGPDEESAHVWADEILLNLIDDDSVSKAFHAVKKWYA